MMAERMESESTALLVEMKAGSMASRKVEAMVESTGIYSDVAIPEPLSV